jgi:hypothetical protein
MSAETAKKWRTTSATLYYTKEWMKKQEKFGIWQKTGV